MRTLRLFGVVTAATMAVTLAACSAGTTEQGTATTSTTTTSPGSPPGSTPGTTVARPAGPAATLAPLTAGRGAALAAAAAVGPALSAAGYTETEYAASGTATSYQAVGELPTDGRYRLEPDASADYATRVVVRRPTDPAKGNGTVVVEWLNVSSGADAAPEYTYIADELLRRGTTWVGVSAQRIGIEGGSIAVQAPGAEMIGAGRGIKATDPERYGTLHHPGDAFAYDMYTQVARAMRAAGAGSPLEGLRVEQVLAVGESQSAMTLTTYRNGVQPLTKAFDGFLIHSRGGPAAPLGKPDAGIDIANVLTGQPTTIRTDGEGAVPTMIVQTESDVLGVLRYLPARQPDDDHLRVWEIAGTAHADRYQVGELESVLGCGAPINRGQQSYVLKAALHHLDAWARGGAAPPAAPPLHVDTSGPAPSFAMDPVGNVQGGVRTPAVDAPVDVLSGLPGPSPSIICILMGSTTPIPPDRLVGLYPSREDYLADYTRAAEKAVAEGFVLAEDKAALLAEAAPDRVAPA
jgi:hypothetical protein